MKLILVAAIASLMTLCMTARGSELLVYSETFDGDQFAFSGVNGAFQGPGRAESVQQWQGLGTGQYVFSGKFLRNAAAGNPARATTLSLTGLPAHDSISIDFLLAAIDSWDGDVDGVGPDRLTVLLDDKPLFSETIANYPASESFQPGPGVELASGVQLGYIGGEFWDSAYNMSLDQRLRAIPHTASTATISWFAAGAGWQGGDDESFAIDGVRVKLGNTGISPNCDFNSDDRCDATDIDLLTTALIQQDPDTKYDVNGDGQVTSQDRSFLIQDVLRTYSGDSNLDGEFDSADLLLVLQRGEYEDQKAANSTWLDGDWSGDQEFDTADLIVAFGDGGFEQGPRSAVAVPEAAASPLVLFMVLLLQRGARCRSAGVPARTN